MTCHRAQRLPVHRGPAAWNSILPPAPRFENLSGSVTADFAIIGGGFAGLSAARRLTQLAPNSRIVLLEAGRIAEGAAGRNSGFMIDLPHELTSSDYSGAGDDRTQITLNRRAIAFAKEAVQEFDVSADFFDPAGKVNGAAGNTAHTHNISYAAHLNALGEAHEMLDARAMLELTGSRHYQSGLYTPGTVMLQPAGYVRGLAKGLSRRISVHEDSPATAIARTGSNWQITTPGGQVTAGTAILATNGHLESFGFAKGRLMHLFLYASMTPELEPGKIGGTSRWGITPSDPMGTTMRRIDTAQGGNRVVTRTCATMRSDMEASAVDLARATRTQRAKFDVRFPQFAGLKPEYEWAGHLCLSLNGVSVTGALEPGLYSACVQNGLGTARGTLTGIAAAEMAFGTQSEITEHFKKEPQADRLPPRAIRDIGANAVLRWKEWRAGAE